MLDFLSIPTQDSALVAAILGYDPYHTESVAQYPATFFSVKAADNSNIVEQLRSFLSHKKVFFNFLTVIQTFKWEQYYDPDAALAGALAEILQRIKIDPSLKEVWISKGLFATLLTVVFFENKL